MSVSLMIYRYGRHGSAPTDVSREMAAVEDIIPRLPLFDVIYNVFSVGESYLQKIDILFRFFKIAGNDSSFFPEPVMLSHAVSTGAKTGGNGSEFIFEKDTVSNVYFSVFSAQCGNG